MQPFQKIKSADSRHLHIQQNHIGNRELYSVIVRWAAIYIVDGLLPVFYPAQLKLRVFLEFKLNQVSIIRIILHEQEVFFHHRARRWRIIWRKGGDASKAFPSRVSFASGEFRADELTNRAGASAMGCLEIILLQNQGLQAKSSCALEILADGRSGSRDMSAGGMVLAERKSGGVSNSWTRILLLLFG